MNKARKLSEYVKEHVLQFLLLGAILSLCLSMRYAALGKYVDYLQESSQAVAGEFFFTSNYLESGAPTTYTIPSWNRDGDKISVEVRNYSNSLKFNEEGVDFFYYVQTDYFSDAECTKKEGLEEFGIKIETHYGDELKEDVVGGEPRTYYSEEVGQFPVGVITTGTTTEAGIDEDGNPTVVEITSTEPAFVPVGRLDGIGTFVSTQRRTDLVYIYIKPDKPVSKNIYLKVTATVVPLKDMDKVQILEKGLPTEEYYMPNENEGFGVFDSTISAIFKMGADTSDADVTAEYTNSGSSNSLKVLLMCGALKNGGSALTRIYFNPEKIMLTLGGKTEAVHGTPEDAKKNEVKNWEHNTDYMEWPLNSKSAEPFYFTKLTQDITIGEDNTLGDIEFVVLKQDAQ